MFDKALEEVKECAAPHLGKEHSRQREQQMQRERERCRGV